MHGDGDAAGRRRHRAAGDERAGGRRDLGGRLRAADRDAAGERQAVRRRVGVRARLRQHDDRAGQASRCRSRARPARSSARCVPSAGSLRTYASASAALTEPKMPPLATSASASARPTVRATTLSAVAAVTLPSIRERVEFWTSAIAMLWPMPTPSRDADAVCVRVRRRPRDREQRDPGARREGCAGADDVVDERLVGRRRVRAGRPPPRMPPRDRRRVGVGRVRHACGVGGRARSRHRPCRSRCSARSR